ncbi:MAG TPA: helix-turn-helix domain-containing protein [Gaiellaceae bacterium]|nr:helix-turn-helix domain-containing protein [Gaiellaceae bacterium]
MTEDAMTNMTAVPELLTGEQVAGRIGLSRERVRQLTGRHDFPPAVGRIGRATVWRADDVDDYVRGVRAFMTVNGISIGIDKARELAVRLERASGHDPAAPAAKVASAIESLLDTGGAIHVTEEEAVAVFAAIQVWLEQTDVRVVGMPLQELRYLLFRELQDAGRFPRT